MALKDRLLELIDREELNANQFYIKTGLGNGFLDKVGEKLKKPSIEKISKTFPMWNIDYLQTGNGEKLKKDDREQTDIKFYDPEFLPKNKRLIPLYDDISTIGGKLKGEQTAKITPDSPPAEWVDPGDWFKSATHAIRHYEHSMIQYPSGCILAMKEVYERQLIVWGNDYVIETDEFRITKRVQRGKTVDCIRAYSTNESTYQDGTLIYEPIDIDWNDVRRIFLVLGYVVKNGSGTIVHTNQNNKI